MGNEAILLWTGVACFVAMCVCTIIGCRAMLQKTPRRAGREDRHQWVDRDGSRVCWLCGVTEDGA